MFTGWMTFTALLAGLVDPQGTATGQGAVSVAPTCRVKGHQGAQLALNCGDGKAAGVVRYWHTPFGELHTHGVQSKLDPVFMHRDGRLVIPNSSMLHSGLYYCLLQQSGGATLWPYELHVGHSHQKGRGGDEHEQRGGRAAIRLSRDVGSEGEEQPQVSDEAFAGAVAASVLLTFVLGFSAGAVSRPCVLRCLQVLTKKLRLSRQQPDTVDSGSRFSMAAMPPMSQGFDMGQTQHDDSVSCTNIDSTASSTDSSPPAKPQRSFRHKREEQQETAAHLEGWDYKKEEEEEAGSSVEEETKTCEEEEGEREDVGSQSEDGEENDGGQSREDEQEADVHDSTSEGEQSRVSEEEKKDDEEGEEGGRRDETEGEDREKMKSEGDSYRDSRSSAETRDDETDNRTQDTEKVMGGDGEGAQAPPPPPPSTARRSRVIRLYQYDEDGQRYCHLPDATCEDPGPVPRPRQRTRSLTRLSAIMAAASAGPLDRRETEDRTHFHVDI